ncbi:glycosyltransferase [Actinomadura barringtoniae]|uniref:Glycosyltransferase n=1 Tax=Actinomadura barringtoniae TaxID=1427535 RepID=A0A939T4N3_9ACTN|nr:glycosyltransferase family 2 protein [Actinomadura barringtoniae]MBO2448464.1 glycosyltransferase [Actinomadura barringtoniae]
MGAPKVSVILPVHNCRESVVRAIGSVVDQTLAAELIEIIAVDDGSTDGTSETLDRLAAEHPTLSVVHQPPSGGPGRPRNVGLDRAEGEYVFFLDADDHLGPEALERMVVAADQNSTDVVVPKYVGVGRKVNPHLFKKTVPFTTIYDAVPNLYGSITVLKLYRRKMLDEAGIRFPEGLLSGEDQIFAVRAYFEAAGVSVLSDYDYYYWVDRDDGTSALQLGGAPAKGYFPQIADLMEYVTAHTEPGETRDRLLRRHFAIEVFSRFDPRYVHFDEGERADTKAAAREILAEYANPQIMKALSPYMRVVAHALKNGPEELVERAAHVHAEDPPPIVVDGDRAFVAYPGFREAGLDVPDEVFETTRLHERVALTGVEWRDGRLAVSITARIDRVDPAEQRAELILRLRDENVEHRVPLLPDGTAELTADIDFATVAGGGPLPAGRWDPYAVVRVGKIVREGKLTPTPKPKVALPGTRIVPVLNGTPCVTPYLTKGTGVLAFNAGGEAPGQDPLIQVTRATVEARVLRLAGTAATSGGTVPMRALLRHRDSKETKTADLAVEASGDTLAFSGELSLQGAATGSWDVSCEVGEGSAAGELRAAAPKGATLSGGRGGRPFRTVKGNLSVEVLGVLGRLRRAFRG